MQATPSGAEVIKLCAVNDSDCNPGAAVTSRGWCNRHYQRWYKHGDPLWKPPDPKVCSVNQDCTPGAKVLALGLCGKHYQRLMKYSGDPLVTASTGECTRCGGPLLAISRYGVCSRTPECRKERSRVRARIVRAENPARAYADAKRFRNNHPLQARVQAAISGARARARKIGVPFSLTKDNMPPMPEICPVLGIVLTIWGSKSGEDSPSLDRIVPALGYVPGNVRWISNRANTLRSNGSARELALVAQDAMRLEELTRGVAA
jgi:hypothetical protein